MSLKSVRPLFAAEAEIVAEEAEHQRNVSAWVMIER